MLLPSHTALGFSSMSHVPNSKWESRLSWLRSHFSWLNSQESCHMPRPYLPLISFVVFTALPSFVKVLYIIFCVSPILWVSSTHPTFSNNYLIETTSIKKCCLCWAHPIDTTDHTFVLLKCTSHDMAGFLSIHDNSKFITVLFGKS